MRINYTPLIASVLRHVREERKQSREQLSRRLNLSAPTIYNMECGKTRVPLSVFFAWLNVAKIDAAALMAQNMFSIQSEQSIRDLIDGTQGSITAKVMRHFRNRLKLSQKELAFALGYSSSSMVHHFEKGIREASATDWCRLIELAQDNLRGMIQKIAGDAALAAPFPTGLAASLKDWEVYWSVHYISAIRQLMRTTMYGTLRFYRPGMFAQALGISQAEEQHALDVLTKLEVVTWKDDKPTIDPAVQILIPKNVSSSVLNQFKQKWVETTLGRYLSQEHPDGIFSVDLIPASPDHFANVIRKIRGLQDEIHNMPLDETSGVMSLAWVGGFTPLTDTRR